MRNKFSAACEGCGSTVKPGEGTLVKGFGRKWLVSHDTCPAPSAGTRQVMTTRFSSGAVVYQNRRGRCEDAPCCGCCS